ncbi:MAG TPA: ABC transporter permease [Blastocatellia bacterium]|nr:ABC transporter permease [Blastocatellia bacterium]
MPNWNHIVRERLAVLRLPPEREIEIVEELALHLEAVYEDALADGLTEAEAEARAVRSYDWRLLECELSRVEQPVVARATQPPLDLIKRKGGIRMESFIQDLRYGARMLAKNPGFTLIAVLTLALGIGANTAIFSVVHALMLRPLPYSEPERVFSICQTDKDPQSRDGLYVLWSYPKLEMLRQGVPTMDFAAVKSVSSKLTSSEEPEQIRGELVTPNYFSVLGVAVIGGRAFTEEENQVGENKVVMISHGFWQERFGGDLAAIGKTIELDKAPRAIIGVLDVDFKGQDGTTKFWAPFKSGMPPGSRILTEPGISWFEVIGRLKRGASRQLAEAELSLMTRRISEKYPWPKGLSNLKDGQIKLVSLRDRKLNPVIRRSFLILLAAVGFVLLIACANLANLMMTRMASRRKELAVRLAVGATRWRIVRQLLVESIVISLVGGMFGLLLAFWGVDLLNKFKPAAAGSIFWANYTNAFNFFSIGMNAPVAIFNFALAAITGVVFGLIPAIQATRADVNEVLKEGSDVSAGAFRRRLNPRQALVALEIAVTLALVIGAGLMVRSFAKLQTIDLGFDPDRILSFSVTSSEENPEFYRQLRDRISSLPGVESVSLASPPPLGGAYMLAPMQVYGRPPESNVEKSKVFVHTVSPDFFSNLRIRILRGRSFTAEDRAGTRRVAILNETAARQFFPHEDPVGQRIKDSEEWAEVVGVAADIKYLSLDEKAFADVYHPDSQFDTARTLVARTSHDPKLLIGAIRNEARAFNKDAIVTGLMTMEQRLFNATSGARFNVSLLSLFGLLALALAAIGIYGVVAYAVSERTREIGVRMALGAEARDVLKLVLFQGMKMIVAGLAIGLFAAFALTRAMKNLLYGVSATDPLTFAVVPLLLAAVALLACYIPARRATKVDPLIALRHE